MRTNRPGHQRGQDGANLADPCIGGTIGKQFDGGVDGHGVEGIAIFEYDGLIGFDDGCFMIIVRESDVSHQFMRFC